MTDKPSPASADGPFIRKVIILFALAALAMFLWQLRTLLMLVFGAIVVAVVFRALADPIRRRSGMPDWAAVACAILLVFSVITGAAFLFGSDLVAQLGTLVDTIPAAWGSLEQRLADLGLGNVFDELFGGATSRGEMLWSNVRGFAMTLGGGLASLLLVLAGGIYFALQPHLYRQGAVKLVPRNRRTLVGEALDDSGRVLKLWLKGQLVSMVLIGVITGTGLWLLGVPSPLALGLLAGLLEFIPYVGPIVAAIPGLLIALASGVDLALWTLGLYTLIQQVEGNFIQPVVQRYAVHIPPALLLFSLIGVGTLFGVAGIILAAPLTVVLYVLVKLLYVREALHTRTEIPGGEDA